MIVLVCGGRDYSDYERVCQVLEDVSGWSINGIEKIIEGGARGADALARRWATENNIPFVEVPAEWNTHGKIAGPLRNQRMLDEHKPDQAVAFPGGRGTLDMLTRLFTAGVNTWIVGK